MPYRKCCVKASVTFFFLFFFLSAVVFEWRTRAGFSPLNPNIIGDNNCVYTVIPSRCFTCAGGIDFEKSDVKSSLKAHSRRTRTTIISTSLSGYYVLLIPGKMIAFSRIDHYRRARVYRPLWLRYHAVDRSRRIYKTDGLLTFARCNSRHADRFCATPCIHRARTDSETNKFRLAVLGTQFSAFSLTCII